MLAYIEKICVNSWWVVLFILLCAALFEQGMQQRNVNYTKLTRQLKELKMSKEVALKEHEELLLQVNSESDPAWVELTLLRSLGMVPEDQTKVFFTKHE